MVSVDRRAWETPELIVMVRSRPEEAVLAGCKYDTTIVGTGASTEFAGCMLRQNKNMCKDDCSAGVSS